MPNLPPSTDFTNSSVTEGQFKTAMTYLREYLASLLGTDGTLATALGALGISFNSVSSKSANYTVIASDRGKTIQCTATLELALTAAATLGSAFTCQVNNTGSGTVTINPNGTELIDGKSTKTISAGQSCIIYCDATGFYTVGLGSSYGGSTIKVFTTSTTWTVPSGITQAIIYVIGGGGGAGGASSGSPGGAGFALCTGLSGSYTITIGAGGSTGGGSGGTSSITGTGVSISSTGGAGNGGASGACTVTTGTALRQITASSAAGFILSGAATTYNATTATPWTITNLWAPGIGGSNVGALPGMAGVVAIQY